MIEIRRGIFGKRFSRKCRDHGCRLCGPEHDDRNSGYRGSRTAGLPALRGRSVLMWILIDRTDELIE
jgi:hypothetical protein